MRATRDERVAVAAEQRGGILGVERELAHRRARVLLEPSPERIVGFESEQTPVEAVGRRWRKAIVRLFVHHRAPGPAGAVTLATRRPRCRDATRARSSRR